MDQGSAEWLEARRGKCTASRLGDLMAVTRDGKPAASRRAYLIELLIERITGSAIERHVTAAMQHGIDWEPHARTAYEWITDRTVEPVGFVPHPTIPDFGASPDGLVGEHGLLEIKCPTTPKHVAMLLGEPIERGWLLQMHGQMMCTHRLWADFVSYDPRLPQPYQTHIRRVMRDGDLVAEIDAAVRAFLRDLAAERERLDMACGAVVPSDGLALPPQLHEAVYGAPA